MGGNYQGHFGIEPVKVLNVPKDHPVLRNVGAIPTSNRLYKAGPLAPRRLSCRKATSVRGGSTR